MKPLLAHVYEPHRVTFPLYAQPKLNGIRALYQAGNFQSRDELPWSPGILSHISDELRDIFSDRTILDSELYVHGWPLQRINGAVTPVRTSQREDTSLVECHVFDQVDYTKSFEERWSLLPHGLQLGKVKFIHTAKLFNFRELDLFYAEQVALGYEGIMVRLGDCPYTTPLQEWNGKWNVPNHRVRRLSDKNNRTWHLLKRKNWLDAEFLITGFNRTVGKLGEPGFQLWCKTKEDRTFSVGSGLTAADQNYYEANNPAGKQAKVQFLCLSDERIPLNPTLIAIL